VQRGECFAQRDRLSIEELSSFSLKFDFLIVHCSLYTLWSQETGFYIAFLMV
jgi:hypothetical protein